MESNGATIRRGILILLSAFIIVVLLQTNWDKVHEMKRIEALNVTKDKNFVLCFETNGSTGYRKYLSNENELEHTMLTSTTYQAYYPLFFGGMAGIGGYKKFHFVAKTIGSDTIRIVLKGSKDTVGRDSSLFIVTVVE